MQQTYTISGMTCNNCAQTIQKTFQASSLIKTILVNFSTQSITITSSKKIPLQVLNDLIQPLKKYTIIAKNLTATDTNPLPKKSIKTYWPLILVLLYLIGFSLYLGWIRGDYNVLMTQIYPSFDPKNLMLDFMGLFFVGFAFFKLLDLKGFAESYRSYDLPTQYFPRWGYVYPFIELILGLMYLYRIELFTTNLLTAIILSISIVGVIQSVLQQRTIKCACLGTGFNLPMSTVTIIEDGIMILMALSMLLFS